MDSYLTVGLLKELIKDVDNDMAVCIAEPENGIICKISQMAIMFNDMAEPKNALVFADPQDEDVLSDCKYTSAKVVKRLFGGY